MIPSSSCLPRQPDQTGQTRRRAQIHRRRPTSRDFVPWRFSDAGRPERVEGPSCRHPKTCTKVEVGAPLQRDFHTVSGSVGVAPARRAPLRQSRSAAEEPSVPLRLTPLSAGGTAPWPASTGIRPACSPALAWPELTEPPAPAHPVGRSVEHPGSGIVPSPGGTRGMSGQHRCSGKDRRRRK